MTTPDYLKCPGGDPVSKAVPEFYPCPACDADIEIWSDEVGGKCLSCKFYFKKIQPPDLSTAFSGALNGKRAKLEALLQYAQGAGATAAAVIPAADIVVDDDLADRCRKPRCESYGLSKSCPPSVPGPSEFRRMLKKLSQAIFFKIDVPSEILLSSERGECFQLLHEIAAGIEQSAVKTGFAGARAYAGGSCKKIFCYDHPECLFLSQKGKCRNPGSARPSMSGFGVNVAKLMETAGWTMNWVTHDTDGATTQMASVCGLVLID